MLSHTLAPILDNYYYCSSGLVVWTYSRLVFDPHMRDEDSHAWEVRRDPRGSWYKNWRCWIFQIHLNYKILLILNSSNMSFVMKYQETSKKQNATAVRIIVRMGEGSSPTPTSQPSLLLSCSHPHIDWMVASLRPYLKAGRTVMELFAFAG